MTADPWQIAMDVAFPPARVSPWYCDRPACDGKPHGSWGKHARAQQHPPHGDWLIWVVQSGRGSGKTRSAAEWVIDRVRSGKARRIALVARTPADARDVMVEGPGGILVNSPPDFRPEYQPTRRQLVWPNGAHATTYSAEAPSQLRGPEHDAAWCDEASSWSDARKGDRIDTAWNNLMLGLRVGEPRCVVTTTPKTNALTRAIRDSTQSVISSWPTYDNLDNLAPSFRESVLATYEGTRIGRQELMGEMLEDVEGALWLLETIDRDRVAEAPEMTRVIVGVDPNGSDDKGADEAGIIVAGRGTDSHGYVLSDRTLVQAGPAVWARRAVAAYREYAADWIVAEGNFGGDMVIETIKAVDRTVPVRLVTASRAKRVRAEPVAALSERGRIHHVGPLPKLEDELTQWTDESGWSPGRLDALVWAIDGLQLVGGAALDAWAEASRIRAARTPEEEAAALKLTLTPVAAARAAAHCPGRVDGHLRRDGQCVACGQRQEAIA